MIELQTHSGFYRCEAYGFAEWLVEIQGLIQKGYEFDFESNSNYPMQIGHIYTAILKPKQSEPKVYPGGSPDTPEMTTEPTDPVLPDKQAETLPVLPVEEAVVPQETTVAKQETDQPVKRAYVSKGNGTGPKPKN